MRFGVCAVVFLFFAGCNHEKAAPATPASAPTAAAASGSKTPPRNLGSNQKMSNTLAMSSDIVQLCGIKSTGSATGPRFDYDKDQLTDDDHNVLQQLAACMLRGPLQGKNVELIGRADPRGTEEYNLALGSRRAGSVSQYLEALGVSKTHLPLTTRGALDATGTDETGWEKDRRVDLVLQRS
jgi:peptidoglycan-associated lipoprotein